MSSKKIVTLAGEFKNHIELKEYANAQYVTLEKATKRIQELEEEVNHLKSLLTSTTEIIEPQNKIVVSPVAKEQEICEVQIERLRKVSLDRELTLEEAKRFDIFNKALLAIKGAEKAIPVDFTHINLDEKDLLTIASTNNE